MKVHIIVDSTVDMPERCREQVQVVPLTVRFGTEEFIDGVTLDKHRFYEKLVESDQLPTTSQATPQDFYRLFRQVAEAGDAAVVITISAALSGTWQSACMAASEFENIYVVDSCSAAVGSGILAEYALNCASQGMSAPALAAHLEEKREDVCAAGYAGIPAKRRADLQIRGFCRRPAAHQTCYFLSGGASGAGREGPRLQTGE